MSEGMIFERLGKFFESKVDAGYKIFDLFICPFCMGTLQSITAHFFAFALGVLTFDLNWQFLARYPLVVMGASIVSGFTWSVYLTINEIKENNRAQAEYFNSINYEYGKEDNSE
jgi:hypothetical protein